MCLCQLMCVSRFSSLNEFELLSCDRQKQRTKVQHSWDRCITRIPLPLLLISLGTDRLLALLIALSNILL